MPQALDSTVAYLGRSFPTFVSLSAGLAALLAPPSHVHSRTAKSSQLVLPLLFGALAPGAAVRLATNVSFAEEPEEEFSHEAHGRELGHECGCHSGSWIKCSAWGSSQCCRCVGTCTCFGYDPSKVEIHLDLKKDELELQPAVSRGPVLETL